MQLTINCKWILKYSFLGAGASHMLPRPASWDQSGGINYVSNQIFLLCSHQLGFRCIVPLAPPPLSFITHQTRHANVAHLRPILSSKGRWNTPPHLHHLQTPLLQPFLPVSSKNYNMFTTQVPGCSPTPAPENTSLLSSATFPPSSPSPPSSLSKLWISGTPIPNWSPLPPLPYLSLLRGRPSSHHNFEFFIITIVMNLSKSLKDKMSDIWNSLLYFFLISGLHNAPFKHHGVTLSTVQADTFPCRSESIIMDWRFSHPGVLCFSSTVTVTKIAGQASIVGRTFMMIFKGVKWKPSSYYCQQCTLPWCYAAVRSLVDYVDYVSRCYKETSKVHFYAELRWSFWCFETTQIIGMVVDKCL